MAGNTPWQAGPGDIAGITIPGPINFYGSLDPVAQQSVTTLVSQTTNLTTSVTAVHATLSTLVAGLVANGLITLA